MQLKRFFAVLPALALSTALVVAQEPQPSTQNQSTQTDVGQPTDTDQPVFKGCVSGTTDNYTLTTTDGKSFRLHSDKDISEHVGKMVEIRGTVKQEGADRPADAQPAAAMSEIDVADLKNVEGSCPSSGASSDMPQSDATNQQAATTEPSATEQPSSTEPAASASAGTETQPASEPATQPEASASASAATESNPDVSASASAGTEAQPSTSADMSASTETTTQPAASAETNTTTEPSASAAVSTQDQSAGVSAGANADVNANQATDQNATATAGNDQNTETSAAQLPQTASPLPLLALLGFASTGLGLVMRRRK